LKFRLKYLKKRLEPVLPTKKPGIYRFVREFCNRDSRRFGLLKMEAEGAVWVSSFWMIPKLSATLFNGRA
jgi:hypothetical protein